MTFLPQPAAGVTATVGLVLAQQPGSNDTPGKEEFGKSSPLGLVVMLLFLVAVVLLVRSMTKHLKRLPESFDEPEQQDKQDEGGASETRGEHIEDEHSVEQAGTVGREDPGSPGAK